MLALVGPSGTGKTTATRLLATRLGYVSDETVSIDPDGTVAPHPKPLSVVARPTAGRGDKQQLSPDDLGLAARPPTTGGWPVWSSCSAAPRAERGLARLGTAEGMLAAHRAVVVAGCSSRARSTPWCELIEGLWRDRGR